MEKQMTAFAAFSQQTSETNVANLLASTLSVAGRAVADKALQVARCVRDHYAALLEQPLTLHQTGLLVRAQVAFVAALLPCHAPLWYRVAACAWLVAVLLKCKREI